jgi:hypothetical protein
MEVSRTVSELESLLIEARRVNSRDTDDLTRPRTDTAKIAFDADKLVRLIEILLSAFKPSQWGQWDPPRAAGSPTLPS